MNLLAAVRERINTLVKNILRNTRTRNRESDCSSTEAARSKYTDVVAVVRVHIEVKMNVRRFKNTAAVRRGPKTAFLQSTK